LHTFFDLVQFCKKPCNPVFNVLQFFKKCEEHFVVLPLPMFREDVLQHFTRRYGNLHLPAGAGVLIFGMPSGTEKEGLLFKFTADTKLKRAQFLKPCGRTTQFSARVHC